MTWPITFEDVKQSHNRIASYLQPTPLRHYPALDTEVGSGIRVLIKHENHQPTNSFKVRNGLTALTGLSRAERERGVVAATRGNHGLGLAYAGKRLGVPVTICVPHGNNPEKNSAMRAQGATVIEAGGDYDASVGVAMGLVEERGLTLIHSTNEPQVLAGATTITTELIEQAPPLDAMVVSVGGGSQAVGALTAARQLAPSMAVYGVQAERASAIHDGFHRGEPVSKESADTFADGLATRSCYALTFPALCEGLADFVTVSEGEIAEAVRLLLRTTHNLAEGAGAAGLAGLMKLAPQLRGKRVGIILSGGNIDTDTLARVLARKL
jgi:threonine dehydratase